MPGSKIYEPAVKSALQLNKPDSTSGKAAGQGSMPLGMVLNSCPEISVYHEGPIRRWHQLTATADRIASMMGISASAWHEAKAVMGGETAATVVAAMLERFADIRSPGGYLRKLSAKAAAGAFSSGPMLMALQRRHGA